MGFGEIAKQAGVFALTVLVGGIGTYFVLFRHPKTAARQPIRLAVNADTVTLSGKSQAYQLVEFTDYQCPVCRAVEKQLPAVLLPYKGRVNLVVRNFPLSYHQYAFGAAVAAEAARAQGKFDVMHNALMAAPDLSAQSVRTIAIKNHLDMKRFDEDAKHSAISRIILDKSEFNALHLPGTPTFLLCSPTGEVTELRQINQLGGLVKL